MSLPEGGKKQVRMLPPMRRSPPRPAAAADSAAAADAASVNGGPAGGAIGLCAGAGIGGTSSQISGSSGAARRAPARGSGLAPIAPKLTEYGAPTLSVGFGADGPAQLRAMSADAQKPAIIAAFSDTNSSLVARRRASAASAKVPVAPPLPPFRYAPPQPNDAANQAWRRHAAPQVSAARAKAMGGAPLYGRAVGGPAPPFLAAPPQVIMANKMG